MHMLTFAGNVREYRNRLNIFRFVGDQREISQVRLTVTAGESRVKLTATDRYRLVDVSLPLTEPAPESGTWGLLAPSVAVVQKRSRVSTKFMAFNLDSETWFVDDARVPVQVDPDLKYPAVDRLWPEFDQNLSEGFQGFNSQYLDSFRALNYNSPHVTVLNPNGPKKPAVVLPQNQRGWRGLVMPIISDQDLPRMIETYNTWED